MKTETIDNKILFKDLPLVGSDFNYVEIDLLLIDPEDELFTVVIQYMMVEEDEIKAGFTLQTGMSANGYDNIVRAVSALIKTGMFDLQEICGFGTFYTHGYDESHDIDWNEELNRISFMDEDREPPIKVFH